MTVHKENFNHFLGPIVSNPFEGVGLAYPAKGFFVPVESASTDEL